jgi:N-acetylneuraminate synthase/N,N'-diacetyllegionaminate synthase
MVEIEGRQIGADHRPYIIAEVGINARTDLQLAKRHIEIAADAGADAVKFQTHLVDEEMHEAEMRAIDAGDVYDILTDCQWTVAEHEKLMAHADKNNITFLTTPYSVQAIERLQELGVDAIKIGSGELSNYHLLDCAARTGKPLLVSTGMHTVADIEEACRFLERRTDEFAVFYCVSDYPTSAADFDFGMISKLHDIADVPVGFSDHSTGVEAAKVAIGYGAQIIEKHFTIDRRLPGPDQEVSIEPDELADICDFSRLYHQTSGIKDGLNGGEQDIKKWANHSIVTVDRIEKGDTFTRDNITTKRPGTGLSARHYFDIIDTQATTALEPNIVVQQGDVNESTIEQFR